MNCLICRSKRMVTEQIQGIEIDRCTRCGGLWLDMLELEKLLDQEPNTLRTRDLATSNTSQPTPDHRRLNCPRCKGTYLIKLNHLGGKNVIIDSCTVCFGNWLDGGEFSKLKALKA